MIEILLNLYLFEGQILSIEKSLTLQVGTQRLTFSKREVQDLRPQETLKKKKKGTSS
jgi:hypothetical protein